MAFAPLPSAAVERWYSLGLYPLIQRTVTPLSNGLPFALLDVLLVAVTIAAIASSTRIARDLWRSRRAAPLGGAVVRAVTVVAVLYITFLLAWGLNYRRLPMSERVVVAPGPPASDEVRRLGIMSVEQVNALYARAHAREFAGDEWLDPSLRRAFEEVQRRLGARRLAVPGRLKHTVLGPYFRWTSVDGMVNPFGLEVLANPDLLPLERWFVIAHEWSHLAGYADEAEASFVGWLTCMHADGRAQYSGWLYLYWQISGEVGAADRARLAQQLAPGPRRDVNAIVERVRRGQLPLLRSASWRVYDRYLKANRVEEGIRSYGAAVTLIAQARFTNGWNPIRRDGAVR